MLKWLIIGGGLHGTHLSHALVHAAGEPPDRVRVLDPYERPLSVWTTVTRNLHMQYLRSLCTDHIDLDPGSLVRFAQSPQGRSHVQFLDRRPCPSLDLFLAHAWDVVSRFRLDHLRWQARATAINPQRTAVRVETDRGCLLARNVVLALGQSEHLHWPDWAIAARTAGATVCHALSPEFRFERVMGFERVVVIGGGMTAAHLAVALDEHRRRTVIIARHAPRVRRFDATRPESRASFPGPDSFRKPNARWQRSRYDGSITPELAQCLRRLIAQGRLEWICDTVEMVVRTANAAPALIGKENSVDQAALIVLATGFEPTSVLPPWLQHSAAVHGLPIDEIGCPKLDAALRWHSRVRVTGRPAEHQLGPFARNVLGARKAGEVILRSSDKSR